MAAWNRPLLLTALFLLIPPAAVAAGFALMYDAALDETRARLRDTAASQAALIEGMARSEHIRRQSGGIERLQAAVLGRITEALERFEGPLDAVRFTLARRQGDHLVFTFRQGAADPFSFVPVPLDSPLAAPMKQAVNGGSGTVTGPDYAGREVMAAYHHLERLDMGLVAKIDAQQLRAPFLHTGLVAGTLGAGLGLLGAGLYLGSTRPLRRRLQEKEAAMERTLANLPGVLYRSVNRPGWPILYISEGCTELTGYPPERLTVGDPGFADLIHPDDAEAVWNTVQQALAAGERFQVTYRLRHADGSLRWCWEQGGAVAGEGEGAELEGYIADVTAAHEARRTQQRLSEILEASLLFVGMADPDGRSLYVNQAGRAMMGIGREADISHLRIDDFHPAWVCRKCRAEIFPYIEQQGPWHGELALLSRGGAEIPVSAVLLAHRDPAGAVEYYSIVAADISDQKAAERAAERERDFSRALLAHLPGPFYLVDSHFRLEHWNERLEGLTGFAPEELAGKPMTEFFRAEDQAYVRERMTRVLRSGHATGEADLLTREGTTVPHAFEGGIIELEGERHLLGFATDITERREQEAEIRRLAYRDPVTGLPNRTNLHELLRGEISRAQRHGLVGAVAYMDMDNFKMINDSLGHPAGDRLLAAFGEALGGVLREEDILARVGGDEFALVLPELADNQVDAAVAAQHALDRALEVLAYPLVAGEQRFLVNVSAGVTLFPTADADPDSLLQQADTAMYEAKHAGKGSIRFFQPAMLAQVRSRLALEQELTVALEDGQLSMHYQPILTADGRRVRSLEALMRWHHPERGWVSPADFIPVAEHSGLIHRLGEWALETALAQLSEWRAAGLEVPVAVNVSPQQMVASDFVGQVIATLARHRTEGAGLILEITEQALLTNPHMVAGRMRELRSHGVHFSVDDFGTGYSSLVHLKQLPLDSVKVDKSFVHDLCESPESQAITETILAMAGRLELTTVAEGVETEAQAGLLAEWGIHALQGFLYARPMPAEDVTAFLRDSAG
jgi:diguanylate cyclase (GGDEF)-like protein/PAS domain S-box-containing protein